VLVDPTLLIWLGPAKTGRIGKLHGYSPTRLARLEQLEAKVVPSEVPVGDHLSHLLDQVVGDPQPPPFLVLRVVLDEEPATLGMEPGIQLDGGPRHGQLTR
jgi:hypothetical protein